MFCSDRFKENRDQLHVLIKSKDIYERKYINVPLYTDMTFEDIERVCDIILDL